MYLSDIIPIMTAAPEFRTLARTLRTNQRAIWVDGLTAPARALLVAAIRSEAPSRPILCLLPGTEHADQIAEDLMAFGVPEPRILAPVPMPAVSEDAEIPPVPVDLSGLRDRLQALQALAAGEATVILAPIAAALQPVPDPKRLRRGSLHLRSGDRVSLDDTAHALAEMGYERVAIVEEPGQFTVRGGILDVFPLNESTPARVDLFGDEIESIRSFDAETQRSLQTCKSLMILPAMTPADGETGTLLDYLSDEALVMVGDPRQIEARWEEYVTEHYPGTPAERERQARREIAGAVERLRRHRVIYLTLGTRSVPWEADPVAIPMTAQAAGIFAGGLANALEAIEQWRSSGQYVIIATDRSERLVELLTENKMPVGTRLEQAAGAKAGADPARSLPVFCLHGTLHSGFALPGVGLTVLTDSEVFGTRKAQRPRRTARQGQRITSLAQLREGDLVVHLHHGIGYYRGLVKQTLDGGEKDYLHLEYAENTRLYVPVDQFDRVTKYIGSEEHPPVIHRVGGTEWVRTKQRARAKVREMAGELVKLYAARQAAVGYAFSPDTPWQREMEESFVYDETPDQLTAIREVKESMEQSQPMDRLVCGDVGYGKTEVAIRAAFKAVMDGKQVAVLVPTTVLAQQHFNTFTERLAAFPARIEMMSRFRSAREQARVARELEAGTVDIVIGTHRLLSKDIKFRDLGMVVVDEEQRFGVAHKERLKQLRTSVDVLTLTATPIPRTLHMSLSGIRDMSLISDPPEGRTPVRTVCSERDDHLIREAILRELDRDGQVYFVHNRVETIEQTAEAIRRLVPQARVIVGHGQMHEDQLEKVMLDFYDRRFDVLVCTTIIESGLDIPNVNTILIDDAPRMGLAQLYQLRGRVGRSPRQAYCYLLFDPRRTLTEIAEKRLEAIREFTQLGSGFQIALRDLEIRGAGNLLGGEQHGFMVAIGFDLYCRMIAEAVKELKGEESTEFVLPPADIPMDAHLPADYIADDRQRLDIYKRMAAVRTPADVQAMQEELRDRFGPEPEPVRNLVAILRLRAMAAEAGLESISAKDGLVTLILGERARLDEKHIAGLKRHPSARKPGWRWSQVRHDRVVVELQGGSPLAAASAVLTALADPLPPPPPVKPVPSTSRPVRLAPYGRRRP